MISPYQGQQPSWGEGLEGPHQMLALTQSHKNAAYKAPNQTFILISGAASPLHTGGSKPPRLGCSASGAGPAVSLGAPRCRLAQAAPGVFTLGPSSGQCLQGELFSGRWQKSKPYSTSTSQVAALSRPPTFTGQSKFMAKPSLNGERRGDTLPPGRGVSICQANQIIALVFWIFFKRPHVILMFSQGSEPLTYGHAACQPVKTKIRLNEFYFIS